MDINESYQAALEKNEILKAEIDQNPSKFRVLTGDRPTGKLHIGHLFGSLQNRVLIQNKGVETFIVIADYQVLTDRETVATIHESVIELTIDYLSAGLDPDNFNTHIFPHSQIPELNQLFIPFLTLISNSELNRNPTVKEEVQASGITNINACMYTYPVHQAADILFCKANLVPVGKDQLPHLELTRLIAKRFNKRYSKKKALFPQPNPLLSDAPSILGLDGNSKMSKSRNNAVLLSATEDETAKLIKKAKTDMERNITYDPENRPEVANLLLLISLCTGKTPEEAASQIGDGGAGKLKTTLIEVLNEYLKPHRERRKELENNLDYIRSVLRKGVDKARETAVSTLQEVRQAMNMNYL